MAELTLQETLEKARTAQGAQLENLLYHRSPEVVAALLENPRLGEQQLVILLTRKDLAREVVTTIAQNRAWMKSYLLKLAVLKHPRTPRHLAMPLLKFVYPFDLLEIAAATGIAADLKRLVEDTLLAQRESLATGQRLSLARRGKHRIASGFLNDSDRRVIDAALSNPALTEQAVAAALVADRAGHELTDAVAAHRSWPSRRGVKLALLRSKHLSLARFASILPELALGDLTDLAGDPRLAPNLRHYVSQLVKTRKARGKKRGV